MIRPTTTESGGNNELNALFLVLPHWKIMPQTRYQFFFGDFVSKDLLQIEKDKTIAENIASKYLAMMNSEWLHKNNATNIIILNISSFYSIFWRCNSLTSFNTYTKIKDTHFSSLVQFRRTNLYTFYTYLYRFRELFKLHQPEESAYEKPSKPC